MWEKEKVVDLSNQHINRPVFKFDDELESSTSTSDDGNETVGGFTFDLDDEQHPQNVSVIRSTKHMRSLL